MTEKGSGLISITFLSHIPWKERSRYQLTLYFEGWNDTFSLWDNFCVKWYLSCSVLYIKDTQDKFSIPYNFLRLNAIWIWFQELVRVIHLIITMLFWYLLIFQWMQEGWISNKSYHLFDCLRSDHLLQNKIPFYLLATKAFSLLSIAYFYSEQIHWICYIIPQ